MIATRLPRTALRPFVRRLWVADGGRSSGATAPRERVLPTGEMHVALRLSDVAFRFLEDVSDQVGDTLGCSVVGGARTAPYFKDISHALPSVGAQLLPGASGPLFGVPAVEITGSHVPLDTLWGGAAGELRERLLEGQSASHRMDLLEDALAERLPPIRGIHPAVSHALGRFGSGISIGDVVQETGYSHRRFIDLFRSSVGLPPKLFCRIRRFQRAVVRLSSGSGSVAEVAFEAGYSDQAHLTRDFQEFAGITPGEYRRRGSHRPGHVPVR